MLQEFNDSHSGSLLEYQFNWGTWNIKLCHAIPNNIGWSLPNNMKRFYEACRYFWTNWERGGSVEWWDKVCSEVLGKPDINAINREREHNNILFLEKFWENIAITIFYLNWNYCSMMNPISLSLTSLSIEFSQSPLITI